MEHEFENKNSAYVEESKEKEVPLNELVKELFSPENLDNQDSTDTLENISEIGIAAYLSISGSELSYEHCPEYVKKSMLGKMAYNEVTAGLIGIKTKGGKFAALKDNISNTMEGSCMDGV